VRARHREYFRRAPARQVEHEPEVERLSAANMKRTWVANGIRRTWSDPVQGEGEEFLRHASQIKNIWVPYGE
jgi:aldehyde dehydrogenase (NAD+)